MCKQKSLWAVAFLLVVSHCLPGFGSSQEVPSEEVPTAFCPTNLTVPDDLPALPNGHGYATPGRYPYMVSLLRQFTNTLFCSGVLVAKDVVLTAASCVDPLKSVAVPFPVVSIGGSTMNGDEDSEIQEVCSTTIHAMYINFTEGFDVALLKLAAPSEKVPVDLLFSDLPDRQEVKSLGWSPKKTSDRLQDFSLTALNNTQCGDSFRESCKCEVNIKDNMICAQTAQKDQCSDGGAGSPILIVPNDDIEPSCGESDVLAGILSFGFQCDYESRKFLQSPNVYTKISSIISWIQTLGDGLENKVYINPDLNATCSEAGK